jgi:hypothetical protein
LNITNNRLVKNKQYIGILKIVILSVYVPLLFTSCIHQSVENGIRQTTTPSTAPMSTLQPNVISTAPTQATTPILHENTSHDSDLYAPIINAYAALERSGYTSFDKDLIGDSLLAESNGSTYNFGWDTPPLLMYAYYDTNGDGSPELLIGADKSISGIYVLRNGTPVSVIQVEDRHNLRLLMDIDGNSIIEDSWGHMGYATDFFYTIDGDRKLVTLDKLFTNGDVIKGDELIGHFRAKDVLGKEVSITEEEYCSLIRKYGSAGYEPLEDTGKERMINVTWKPVAT